MIQLAYFSMTETPWTTDALTDLLMQSRAANAAADITGVLLYQDARFLQFLEGDDDRVRALYAKIARDPRHTRVSIPSSRAIDERQFRGWSMGFAQPPAGLMTLDGFTDFLRTGDLRDFTEAEGPLATWLQRFRDGSWGKPRSTAP